MKKELQILLSAFMFYTRINISKFVEYKEENLSLSTKYFPLVGYIVGGLTAITFILCNYIFSDIISVILSLLVSVLITGGFHEDGLADTCDAFGGGWTKEKILTIMKDSRIGTYGVIGLILAFTLKIALLIDIYPSVNAQVIILFTISAHSLSRFIASTFIFTHTYSRNTDDSKSKPVAENINSSILFIAGLFAFIPFIATAYYTHWYLLLAIIPMYITKYFLGNYFNKWIGGYTGDTLGATQQITEIIFYLSSIAIWKFI